MGVGSDVAVGETVPVAVRVGDGEEIGFDGRVPEGTSPTPAVCAEQPASRTARNIIRRILLIVVPPPTVIPIHPPGRMDG
jgi:hypothetical protein